MAAITAIWDLLCVIFLTENSPGPALAVFAFRARKSNAHLSVRLALKQKHRSGLLIPTQGQAVGLAPNYRINQNTPGKKNGGI